MKIVISPAKSLNFDAAANTLSSSRPRFTEEPKQIMASMKELSPAELSKLQHISQNLADLNWERNQVWHKLRSNTQKQAVFAFNGDVYEGLDVNSLTQEQVEELSDRLRILSGLYGLLRPLDLIKPHRLEMGTPIQINGHKNLYDFWGDKIARKLSRDLDKDKVLINLASNEYFKSVKKHLPKNVNIITPEFKEYKGSELKTISFFAKKARGKMTRYIVENRPQTPEELIHFDWDGYKYAPNLSKNGIMTFIR